VDPFNMSELEKILREETARPDPSVIIARRPCALIDKRERKPIDFMPEKCKKCGLCFKLGCPAIENVDGVAVVNTELCNYCGLCSGVCKFGALGVE